MKKIIEMILSLGLEEAQKELAESQIVKSYRKTGPMEERNILPDKPPSQSWDNIIRKLEE